MQTTREKKQNYNTKFINAMISDLFFSKNLLEKVQLKINPFYSRIEKKLKEKLSLIKDQRCLGYINIQIKKNEEDFNFISRHREQGNLKARLIKNYDKNDELIIINTAGGLTSGDTNINSIVVSDNITLNITTQSMEKVYKCKDYSANAYSNIIVGANSYVSWIPLETIFFNGGNLRRRINIELEASSNFLGIETIIFGRQAMGEIIKKGSLNDAWQIFREDKLVYSDFNELNGNINYKISNGIIMNGNNIFCNVIFSGKKIKAYSRKILSYINKNKYFAGTSIVNGVMIIKVLSKDINEIRIFLSNLLDILDNNFNLPKIWSF